MCCIMDAQMYRHGCIQAEAINIFAILQLPPLSISLPLAPLPSFNSLFSLFFKLILTATQLFLFFSFSTPLLFMTNSTLHFLYLITSVWIILWTTSCLGVLCSSLGRLRNGGYKSWRGHDISNVCVSLSYVFYTH